jgi:hypothetical protein
MSIGMRTLAPLALAAAVLAAPSAALAVPHTTFVNSPFAPEQSIFQIMDTLYGVGNWTRVNDGNDQWWTNLGNAGARASAKYAQFTQGFGYVDGSNTFQQLFSVTGNGYLAPGAFVGFTPAQSGNPFRWADNATNGGFVNYWTSLESDNAGDSYVCFGGPCVDHMISFLITGGSSAGNYVVAFEDLARRAFGNYAGASDRDFNDLVVEIEGARPSIPEPGTVVLVGLGLGALALRARRRS